MGAKISHDLIAARPFEDLRDLRQKVPGLGKEYIETMAPYLVFEGASSQLDEPEEQEPEGDDGQEDEEPEADPEPQVQEKPKRRRNKKAA